MNWDWDSENGECRLENVPFVLGPGHYNEARHGLMDVAGDEPCPASLVLQHLDTSLSR